MIQPKIQTIFIPSEMSQVIDDLIITPNGTKLSGKKRYVFTPEEFEAFKREFGKGLLKKAADNARLKNIDLSTDILTIVDKENITETLEPFLEQHKL